MPSVSYRKIRRRRIHLPFYRDYNSILLHAVAPTAQPQATMSEKERRPFTALYLAAGLSSRFGGKIKCLQAVGRHGETLLELSVRQVRAYGVSDVVMVVSEATEASIRAVAGDAIQGLPVSYARQTKPEWRAKPMGTVHALLAARPFITQSFVVLNGDTLYGATALSLVCEHVSTRAGHCLPGYALRAVLPERGRVNRAVIGVNSSGHLTEIVEQYDIGREDIPSKYTGSELTSMNIFGFQPSIFDFAARKFDAWFVENSTNEKSEYILSTMLNDLFPEDGVVTHVYPLDTSTPLELTNPEDFAYVRNNLSLVGL